MTDTLFVLLNDSLAQIGLENTVQVIINDTIVQAGLENKVYLLNDTLPHTHLDILAQVETFYNNALNRVLWIIGTLVAIVGVVSPIALYAIQRQSSRDDRDSFRNEMNRIIDMNQDKIRTEIQQTKNDLNNQIEELTVKSIADIEKFSKEMTRARAKSEAVFFGLTITRYLREDAYHPAFLAAVSQIRAYIEMSQFDRIPLTIDLIIKDIVPYISIPNLQVSMDKLQDAFNWTYRKIAEVENATLNNKVEMLKQAIIKRLSEKE